MKTETLHVIEQSVFMGRQITFDILWQNNNKIGMNTQANKFYHITKMIGLDKLYLSFVHSRKLWKHIFLNTEKRDLKLLGSNIK